jgi:hypothetical protein
LAMGALYPEPVALFLQAASVGMVLLIVASILRRSVSSGPRKAAADRRSPSSIVRRTSPSSRQRPRPVGSVSSTEIKAPVEVGLQESQS